jgi:hypothetical protein
MTQTMYVHGNKWIKKTQRKISNNQKPKDVTQGTRKAKPNKTQSKQRERNNKDCAEINKTEI